MGGLVSSFYVYLAGEGIRLGQSREPSFWRKQSLDESAMVKLEGCRQPVPLKAGEPGLYVRMQQAWLALE